MRVVRFLPLVLITIAMTQGSLSEVRETQNKISDLTQEMKDAATKMDYELAAKLKIDIEMLELKFEILKEKMIQESHEHSEEIMRKRHLSLQKWSADAKKKKARIAKYITAGVKVVNYLVEYMITRGVRTFALKSAVNMRGGLMQILFRNHLNNYGYYYDDFKYTATDRYDVAVYQDFTFSKRPFGNIFTIGEESKTVLDFFLSRSKHIINNTCFDSPQRRHKGNSNICLDARDIIQYKNILDDDQLSCYQDILDLHEVLTTEDIHLTSVLLNDVIAMPFFLYHLVNSTNYSIGMSSKWLLVIQLWSEEDCTGEEEKEAMFYKDMLEVLDESIIDIDKDVFFFEKKNRKTVTDSSTSDLSLLVPVVEQHEVTVG